MTIENRTVDNEEPWVAEFRREFVEPQETSIRAMTLNNEPLLLHLGAKAADVIAFIQKTLEADRKERAGVVLKIVENMKVLEVEVEYDISYPYVSQDKVIEIIKDVMK